jgi:hypothetical protein
MEGRVVGHEHDDAGGGELGGPPDGARTELLLHATRSLVAGAPPLPWDCGVFITAGGVIAAGWTGDDNVLLVSHDGYSVSAPDGKRLAREVVRVAGL